MGTNLKDLLFKKEINIEDLNGKVLVVDSFNILYQFLSSIRQRDGSLLMDSQGNITSHLAGLFNRTTKLMSYGLKLAFVFDGEPPKLKHQERERRKNLKVEAEKRFEKAKAEEDLDAMKKYAARTSKLTEEMIEEATLLIRAMGCPIVQAPSEGEAQAALIVDKGDAFATVSEDYDSLLYGSLRLVKNLTITGRKKQKDKLSYEIISPAIVDLSENLKHLNINREQLIVIAMLVGTDFNVGGIKGIGPKKAYDLVKTHKMDFNAIFKEINWQDSFDVKWEDVFDLIKNMPVKNNYKLRWEDLDKKKIMELLIEKHDFSEARVESTLSKLEDVKEKQKQKGLQDFFKK